MEKYLGIYRNGTNRRPAWDYAKPSAYFVTICTRNRIPWFGDVRNGRMRLSTIGTIATDEWARMGTLRPNITLDEWIIMPDHIHGIITILYRLNAGAPVPTPFNGAPAPMPRKYRDPFHLPNWNPGALGPIIQQFKRACTIRIFAAGNTDFAWQTRYHDHIIRDEDEARRIRTYIRNNPLHWQQAMS